MHLFGRIQRSRLWTWHRRMRVKPLYERSHVLRLRQLFRLSLSTWLQRCPLPYQRWRLHRQVSLPLLTCYISPLYLKCNGRGICSPLSFRMQSQCMLSPILFSTCPHPLTYPLSHFFPIPFLFISLPYHHPFLFFSVFSIFSVLPLPPFSLEIFCRIQFGDGARFPLGLNLFPGTKFCFLKDVLCPFCVTRHMWPRVYWYVNSYSYWSGDTIPFISVSTLPSLLSSFLQISQNRPH